MLPLISDLYRLLSQSARPLPAVALLLLLATLTFWPASPALADDCESRASVTVDCGKAPSATFDKQGRLWVTFVHNKHVYVAYSDDHGNTFSSSIKVNEIPEDAEFNGENRPKIIVADNGTVLLSWTKKTSNRFTGEIRFSRSIDGGNTFEPPRTINDDGLDIGHRFDSLHLTATGRLYLTWIDKRDLEASLGRGDEYAGAAIYYTVSDDLGASFKPNMRVANHSCECCRIAVAPHGDDNVAILWRQIFGDQIRDHAIAVLSPDGVVTDMQRATVDDWHIEACPHHGPTMIPASSNDQYHISWFSAGSIHSGIHYGRYNLADASVSDIIQVDGTPGAGHPFLAEFNGILYLVWKAFDGMSTPVRLMQSHDEGHSWSIPETLITTDQASDHPLLTRSANGVFLSWSSEQHGYVFKEITRD